MRPAGISCETNPNVSNRCRSAISLAPSDALGHGPVGDVQLGGDTRSTEPKLFQVKGFVSDALVGRERAGFDDGNLEGQTGDGANSLRTCPPFIFFVPNQLTFSPLPFSSISPNLDPDFGRSKS